MSSSQGAASVATQSSALRSAPQLTQHLLWPFRHSQLSYIWAFVWEEKANGKMEHVQEYKKYAQCVPSSALLLPMSTNLRAIPPQMWVQRLRVEMSGSGLCFWLNGKKGKWRLGGGTDRVRGHLGTRAYFPHQRKQWKNTVLFLSHVSFFALANQWHWI